MKEFVNGGPLSFQLNFCAVYYMPYFAISYFSYELNVVCCVGGRP